MREPHRAIVKSLSLAVAGKRVGDALAPGRARTRISPASISRSSAVGIFGRLAGRDQLLEAGDRIEIYRPLAADPKAARRARAKQARENPDELGRGRLDPVNAARSASISPAVLDLAPRKRPAPRLRGRRLVEPRDFLAVEIHRDAARVDVPACGPSSDSRCSPNVPC